MAVCVPEVGLCEQGVVFGLSLGLSVFVLGTDAAEAHAEEG